MREFYQHFEVPHPAPPAPPKVVNIAPELSLTSDAVLDLGEPPSALTAPPAWSSDLRHPMSGPDPADLPDHLVSPEAVDELEPIDPWEPPDAADLSLDLPRPEPEVTSGLDAGLDALDAPSRTRDGLADGQPEGTFGHDVLSGQVDDLAEPMTGPADIDAPSEPEPLPDLVVPLTTAPDVPRLDEAAEARMAFGESRSRSVPEVRPDITRPARATPPLDVPTTLPRIRPQDLPVRAPRDAVRLPGLREAPTALDRIGGLEAEILKLNEVASAAELRAARAEQRADEAAHARDEALRRAERVETDFGVTAQALRSVESVVEAQLNHHSKLEAALRAAAEWDAALSPREPAALAKIQKRADKLVREVSRLPEFVASRDLRDELAALRGADPRDVLQALDVLLREALGDNFAAAPHARYLDRATPEQLRETLKFLKGVVERHRAEVAVAPAADGKVDGRFGRREVESVTVRDSVGVVRGDDSTITVVHQCEVEEPVIEIAELLKLGPDGPLFSWSSDALRPGRVTGTSTSVTSNALAVDFWTNIWSSSGVAVGDNITMEITRRHTIEGCQVNLAALLSDTAVRNDLALARGDTEEAQAARDRLPHTVQRALGKLDLGNLVPIADVARQASVGNRPRIRQSGARLTVAHGAGVGVGRNPSATARTRMKIADPRVR